MHYMILGVAGLVAAVIGIVFSFWTWLYERVRKYREEASQPLSETRIVWDTTFIGPERAVLAFTDTRKRSEVPRHVVHKAKKLRVSPEDYMRAMGGTFV